MRCRFNICQVKKIFVNICPQSDDLRIITAKYNTITTKSVLKEKKIDTSTTFFHAVVKENLVGKGCLRFTMHVN